MREPFNEQRDSMYLLYSRIAIPWQQKKRICYMDVSICVVASHKPTDALLMNTHKYNENALNGREREKIKARATIERNSNAMIV